LAFSGEEGGFQPLGQLPSADRCRENRSAFGNAGIGSATGDEKAGDRNGGDVAEGSFWEKSHGGGGFLKNRTIHQRAKRKSAKSA
jgi:hypothetical protein